MSEIMRLDYDLEGNMVPEPQGTFVLFRDVGRLQAEHAAELAKVKRERCFAICALAKAAGWKMFPYITVGITDSEQQWCPPGEQVHISTARNLPPLHELQHSVCQLREEVAIHKAFHEAKEQALSQREKQAAEHTAENARLREAIARMVSNAGAPHKVKEIAREVLGE